MEFKKVFLIIFLTGATGISIPARAESSASCFEDCEDFTEGTKLFLLTLLF